MKNKLNTTKSEQSISNLTLSDLENIIEIIVKRTIEQEMMLTKPNLEQSFLATLGVWQEDEKSDEEIIKKIYESRNTQIAP